MTLQNEMKDWREFLIRKLQEGAKLMELQFALDVIRDQEVRALKRGELYPRSAYQDLR